MLSYLKETLQKTRWGKKADITLLYKPVGNLTNLQKKPLWEKKQILLFHTNQLETLQTLQTLQKKNPFGGKKQMLFFYTNQLETLQPPWRWNFNAPLGQAKADINIQNKNVRKQSPWWKCNKKKLEKTAKIKSWSFPSYFIKWFKFTGRSLVIKWFKSDLNSLVVP